MPIACGVISAPNVSISASISRLNIDSCRVGRVHAKLTGVRDSSQTA